MTMRRLLPICLSVFVVLTGLWLVIVAQEGGTTSNPPLIETVHPQVGSPGDLVGLAAIPGGGDVVVEAFIDGEPLDGSPDEEMEGENNEFHFHVPPGHEGKEVTIVATASDGTATVKHVPIRND